MEALLASALGSAECSGISYPSALPKQLETVKGASEFPVERHRWNTNEEVAAILVAFDRHETWESLNVYIRPPSGMMLLYNRKKARYRKDGYCWKKRRDGKTTREDHMKLKVQGVECIYGCYVHSAILPTFHRRCYWLLQNPDIVLVHYLNVPPADSNRLCSTSALQKVDCTEWTRTSLVNQLRPMFASVRHLDVSNKMDDIVEDAIHSLVNHLMPQTVNPLPSISTNNRVPVTAAAGCSVPVAVPSGCRSSVVASDSAAVHNGRFMQLMHGNLGNNPTNIISTAGTAGQASKQPVHTTAPLILNLTPLPGSGGLLILSSQSVESAVSSRPSPAVNWHSSDSSVANTFSPTVKSYPQQLNDSGNVISCHKPSNATPDVGSCDSSRKDFDVSSSSKFTSLQAFQVKNGTSVLDPVSMSQAFGTGYRSDEASKSNCNDLTSFDCLSLLLEQADDCTSNASAVGGEDVSGDANAVNINQKCESIVDELDDILHLVNESLGQCDGEEDTSSSLHDCNLSLGDSFASVSSPKSSHVATDSDFSCQNITRTKLIKITDFSPEWSYVEGGIKVLVTGPWYLTTSLYEVLFDDIRVSTTMVQSGVIRCYSPAHRPGVVCLRVACDGHIISEDCTFEYRTRETDARKDRLCIAEEQLKTLLVWRLQFISDFLECDNCTSRNQNFDYSERFFMDWIEQLSTCQWKNVTDVIESDSSDLTLLHLAAGLGYARLIRCLIKWSEEKSCAILERDIDSLSVDQHGNTPLMWACARGHTDAMVVLHHWNPLALLGFMGQSRCTTPAELHRVLMPIDDWLAQSSGTPSISLSSQYSESHENSPLTDDRCVKLTRCSLASDENSTSCLDGKSVCNGDSQCIGLAGQLFEESAAECTKSAAAKKRTRLMKRTSVDILPDYRQMRKDAPKMSKTASIGECDTGPEASAKRTSSNAAYSTMVCPSLRTSSSDSHLSGLSKTYGSTSNGADPMISMIDRDINSPVMYSGDNYDDVGFSLEDMQRDTVAMDMDSPNDFGRLSNDGSEVLHQSTDTDVGDFEPHSNQMMTLASQIIAAMPERIKLTPNSEDMDSRRNRAASYGSFSSYSSCSSNTAPPLVVISTNTAEDSGISTPLTDGNSAFHEYRYSTDLGTPLSSALSPKSTCVLSPYNFDIDSPPPTAAEFTEYFNAPAMYMEKDFSQLTLSDEEQHRLYEAAKIIQSFYRRYKDKKEQNTRQQQREIEAAVLIQSYYRRYKQFMYYKRMTQAAVLIQSQFRSYYAQKRFRRSREAATIIQNRYRAYKEYERYKRSQNAAVIIQQRFRSHYQRIHGKQTSLANTVQKMMADRDVKSDNVDQKVCSEDTERGQSFTKVEEGTERGSSSRSSPALDTNSKMLQRVNCGDSCDCSSSTVDTGLLTR